MASVSIDPNSGFCAANGIYYSKRQPAHLPLDIHLSLPAFIFSSSTFDPSATAFIDSKTADSLSYGDLRAQVYTVAAGLVNDLGVRPGDVVLLLSPNSLPFPIVVFAVMAIGAIITTTNPLNQPLEIFKQAKDSGAKFVATLPSLLPKLQALSNLPLLLLPEQDSTESKTLNLARSFPLCISFSKLLLSHTEGFRLHSVQQDDTAALLYSSGTTGTSKGVILTHRNFIAQIRILLGSLDTKVSPWHSRVYMCLIPMFHVYGLSIFGLGLIAQGATVVLQQKFDLVETLHAIQRFKVTDMPVVPPVLVAMAKLPVVKQFDLSSLRSVGSGAGPLSKEVMDAFRSRFPNVSIPQGYGMTESTAVGAHTATEEEAQHSGSAGLIAPNTEFKIVDIDRGLPLPPTQRGGIWMRGPTIMKGYFGRPGETAATIDKEGWLHTGDIGYIDREGFVYVVDRLKELIKYKGLQVAPAELEAVLLSHPKIMDAAVIPYPDHEAGQIPMAFIVRQPASGLTEADVMNFVAEQVAPYKKVRRVAFVNNIPKSAAGKILRRELVTMATSRL